LPETILDEYEVGDCHDPLFGRTTDAARVALRPQILAPRYRGRCRYCSTLMYAINWSGENPRRLVYTGRTGETALENSRDISVSHLHEHPLLSMVDAHALTVYQEQTGSRMPLLSANFGRPAFITTSIV
jgi:hypothetical protein